MKHFIAAALMIGTLSEAGLAADTEIEAQAEAIRVQWQAKPSQAVPVTVPLSERTLAFDLPFGFVPAFQSVQGDSFLMEYLPDGQDFDNWKAMVVVTELYSGTDNTIPHPTQASDIFNTMTGCDSGLYYRMLGARQVHPDMSVAIINRSCAKVAQNAYSGAKPIGEQNLILHFRTSRDTFTVQYNVRGIFKNGKRPFSDEEVVGILARFGTITLCPQSGPCEGALTL